MSYMDWSTPTSFITLSVPLICQDDFWLQIFALFPLSRDSSS